MFDELKEVKYFKKNKRFEESSSKSRGYLEPKRTSMM